MGSRWDSGEACGIASTHMNERPTRSLQATPSDAELTLSVTSCVTAPARLSFCVRPERRTCAQFAWGYTKSMSAKEAVLQAIHRLPDDVDYRAIAEEIAFLSALEQGDQDIHSGRVVSNEDVRKKLDSWTSS